MKTQRRRAGKKNVLIALDIGPIGQLLEPTGTLSFEEAYDIFREAVIAGSGCDVIVFETMTDLYELKAALLAAKENSDKPVICTMTFEENMRTFTGCSISSMALTLEGLGADAIGVNCSLGPKELYPLVKELCSWTSLPVVVKPNAGLPDPVTNEYSIEPEEFAELMKRLVPLGVKIFGGCCGTSPDYIKSAQKCSFKGKVYIGPERYSSCLLQCRKYRYYRSAESYRRKDQSYREKTLQGSAACRGYGSYSRSGNRTASCWCRYS